MVFNMGQVRGWVNTKSNIVLIMKQIFNSTEEMEASVDYTDIRFTVLKRVTSDVEQEDIEPQVCFLPPFYKPLFLSSQRLPGPIRLILDGFDQCLLCASFLRGSYMT